MLVIAGTGLALQLEAMWSGAGWGPDTASASFVRPPATACTPPPVGSTGGVYQGRSLHEWLIRIHRGDRMGRTGMWISSICGLALLVFAITGMWVYLQMFVRRWRMRRRSLFW